MNNQYLDRAKKVIPDPQVLSVVASRRARQLALGARPMIKCDAQNHIDVALLEIAEGLLDYEFCVDDQGRPIVAASPEPAAETAETTETENK